ncbi:MAG: S8 family serine peptidase [Planctomycetota bacterium]|nr:S8 family serine peptidase [Planctomycetota bacterium]
MPTPIVGIIDTGIDEKNPWLEKTVTGGVTVCDKCEGVDIRDGFGDWIGHGTAVASVLHSFCPEAQLFAIRIFGHEFQTTAPWEGVSEKVLAAALDYCLAKGIGIVNISFSMARLMHPSVLEKACCCAAKANCIIVASHRSDGGTYYPAGLSYVLGVRRSIKCASGVVTVLSYETAEVATWGGPVILPHAGGCFCLTKGASFSAPAVAGLVARARCLYPDISLPEILNIFHKRECETTNANQFEHNF